MSTGQHLTIASGRQTFTRQVVAVLPNRGATVKELMPMFHGKTHRQIDKALQMACNLGLAFRLVPGRGGPGGNHTVYAPCAKLRQTEIGAVASVFDYAQKLGAVN